MKNRGLIIVAASLQTISCSEARVSVGKVNKEAESDAKPNVLFVCIDDFRHEMGAYGSQVKTPNMDYLASQGSLFTNQFVSCPTSGASRYGLLTGMYPTKPIHLNNEACRDEISNKQLSERPETFFHQLRRHGYYTVGIGKISHYVDGYVYGYEDEKSDVLELPYSWDEMLFDPGKWGTGWNAFFGYEDGSNRQGMKKKVKPYECGAGDDLSYPDGLTAELAVKEIGKLAALDKPFCLAVGFFKPHLPFNAPKKYWDMYREDEIKLSPEPDIPEGMDRSFLHNSAEFNGYQSGEYHPSIDYRVPDEYAIKLRHAYYACVSYSDAQIGKLIDALKKNGLYDNTIIILWGDHGWHLGDQRVWGKHTVLETAASSALVVKAPGHKAGTINNHVVSSIDIYPSLMELCGVPCPDGLDGHSFVGTLDNPDESEWNDQAYTYYRQVMSVRVPGYRLVRSYKNGKTITELYQIGDDRIEHVNIADKEQTRIKELGSLLDGRPVPF